MRLLRVNRVVTMTVDLGTFDFGVPVRTLDQTNHQPVFGFVCEIDQPVHHVWAPLLVGLNDKTNAIEISQRRLPTQLLEQVE